MSVSSLVSAHDVVTPPEQEPPISPYTWNDSEFQDFAIDWIANRASESYRQPFTDEDITFLRDLQRTFGASAGGADQAREALTTLNRTMSEAPSDVPRNKLLSRAENAAWRAKLVKSHLQVMRTLHETGPEGSVGNLMAISGLRHFHRYRRLSKQLIRQAAGSPPTDYIALTATEDWNNSSGDMARRLGPFANQATFLEAGSGPEAAERLEAHARAHGPAKALLINAHGPRTIFGTHAFANLRDRGILAEDGEIALNVCHGTVDAHSIYAVARVPVTSSNTYATGFGRDRRGNIFIKGLRGARHAERYGYRSKS